MGARVGTEHSAACLAPDEGLPSVEQEHGRGVAQEHGGHGLLRVLMGEGGEMRVSDGDVPPLHRPSLILDAPAPVCEDMVVAPLAQVLAPSLEQLNPGDVDGERFHALAAETVRP